MQLLSMGYSGVFCDSDSKAGGCAGGLLTGAVVHMRPYLFHVAIVDMRFVDTTNTMLDPSMPLTVLE